MKSGSISQAVVEPYADALMSLAKEHSLIDNFGNDAQLILSALGESDDLKRLLAIPLVSESVKKDVIQSIFAERINPLMQSFMLLLVDRGRIVFLEAICLQYQALLRQRNQVSLAEITSAIQLSEAQQETLKQKVTALTNARSVELNIKVNPDLIGGVIIKVGSQVIDASIRGQLRRLTSRLTSGVTS